jgi:hypothetical protein
MSTRSTTHFFSGNDPKPTAIIYRHGDGYPEGAGSDLLAFIEDQKANAKDNRLDDPSYLAARYVAFLGRLFSFEYVGDGKYEPKAHPLSFISVGVCMEDPGDIEYRYEVRCGAHGTVPEVKCFAVEFDTGKKKGRAKKIPAPKPDEQRDAALGRALATAATA